jgi:hypothetical protein
MLHSINATYEFLAKPSNYDAQRFSTEIQDQLLVSYLSQIFQRQGKLVAPKSYQSYGIAPIWLAGENIYLGESALHVDNYVTLSSMNNEGDAGNRNPRKTSLCIPIGFK